jgi:hypothetical protein
VVAADPQLGDDVRISLWDLVMSGAGIGVLGSAISGDTAPAPGSSCAAGPGVSRLYLSGSPGFLPPPINWRRAGDEAEIVCSWVATTESCCMRRWSWSTRTSCIQFGFV